MEPIVTGVIVWLLRLVIGNSGLTSSRSDLEIAGWLPGLVTVDRGMVSWTAWCGLWVRNLFLYVIRPLSVYSGCQGAAVNILDTILAFMVLASKEVRQALSKQTNALSRPSSGLS